MEKVLVDANIIMDLLEKREEFYQEAQELFTLSDKKNVKLFVSALTLANVHFLLYKHLKMEARKVLAKFKVLVEVLAVDDKIIDLSLTSDLKDFEDAIQYYTAIENDMDIIITRNKKDFKNVNLPILTAKEFLNR
ncbi:MAG TPA: PIN domain-containing protein [Chitinophagales bacterium]|nr:PIN domain-containing protein [Chitinophagales bacterium]HMV01757.1 PIN domain-containing protein [Chitinophagales bacterium]HMW94369.1 PIN domain-containing protein [Chitinophagales bacterium]HMZ93280.1 PIN domain-containing protein [Chitinophagales bacterium]HNB39220.1 PIN domain-containing protein [Chitinophagales bacterium]